MLIIPNGKKILINIKVVVNRQVKMENSPLPVAVRVSKTCMLKLPTNNMAHFKIMLTAWDDALKLF